MAWPFSLGPAERSGWRELCQSASAPHWRACDRYVSQDGPDCSRAGGGVGGRRSAVGRLRDCQAGRHRVHGGASPHRSRGQPGRTVVPCFRPFAIAGNSETPIRQAPIGVAGVRSHDACGWTRVRNHPSNRFYTDTLPRSTNGERGAFECARRDLQGTSAGAGVPAPGTRRFRCGRHLRMAECRGDRAETQGAQTSDVGLWAGVSE